MAWLQTLAQCQRETARGVFSPAAAKKRDHLPFPPQIIYLRRFKDLRGLSLSGNPIAEAEDYSMFILAYLPDLVYLDSRRIDDHMASVSLWVSQFCETVFRSPGFTERDTEAERKGSSLFLTLTCLSE